MPPPRRPGTTLSSGAMRGTLRSTLVHGHAMTGPASSTASRHEIRRRDSRTTSSLGRRNGPAWVARTGS
eukprot:1591560-Alexandrium_andersonii.AAC.1